MKSLTTAIIQLKLNFKSIPRHFGLILRTHLIFFGQSGFWINKPFKNALWWMFNMSGLSTISLVGQPYMG
jgi:hypothetical protein